jgi:serine/threonine-protein kinase RsbW
MAEPILRIRLSLDSSLENVRLTGMCAQGICRGLEMSEDEAYEVELALCEAANNAIRHAYKEEPGHLVDVEVETSGQVLRFLVSDTGRAMDPALLGRDAAGAFQGVDDLSEGGMGLGIIKSVMDSVEYGTSQGKNTLRMTKRLKG